MKYVFTDKSLNLKKCPVCGKSKIGILRLMCDNCNEEFNKEPHLNKIDWMHLNKWCRRLPFARKLLVKLRIWKFLRIFEGNTLFENTILSILWFFMAVMFLGLFFLIFSLFAGI